MDIIAQTLYARENRIGLRAQQKKGHPTKLNIQIYSVTQVRF